MKKSEINRLIMEVLEESWFDKIISKNMKFDADKLYKDAEKWFEHMVDDSGFYIGPNLHHYPFTKGDYVDTRGDRLLHVMMEWNEKFAEENNIDYSEVSKANKEASLKFYNKHGFDDLTEHNL